MSQPFNSINTLSAHSTKRVWIHYLTVGRIIVGAVANPEEDIYTLIRPVEIAIQQAPNGQMNLQMGNPFLPLNPPKDQILRLQPTAIMQSFECDETNAPLLKGYREQTSSILQPIHGPILTGGGY